MTECGRRGAWKEETVNSVQTLAFLPSANGARWWANGGYGEKVSRALGANKEVVEHHGPLEDPFGATKRESHHAW